MATTQHTADFFEEQLARAGEIRTRKMFGEHALYCDDKVVAFICDDELYVKPTAVAVKFLDDTHLAPPYPGAKGYYLVPGERWDDAAWLTDFVRQTADSLSLPQLKQPKKSVEKG